jgi:hypothetical protein
VGSHAGAAVSGVDVAWAFRPGRSNIGPLPGLSSRLQV